MFFNLVFNALDGFVKAQRYDAQHNDAGDYHIQLEYLGAVNDQVAKPPSCRKEFADDDAHQGKPDVYLSSA